MRFEFLLFHKVSPLHKDTLMLDVYTSSIANVLSSQRGDESRVTGQCVGKLQSGSYDTKLKELLTKILSVVQVLIGN